MANSIYPKYKEALIQAAANVSMAGTGTTGTTGVYAALVRSTYTYSAGHQFVSDLGANIAGTDQELSTKTYADGVFDGSDPTWTAVTGAACNAIVLYVKNAGANTTWRLVAYLDTNITNLPVTPNGGNITVTFNASGIFGL